MTTLATITRSRSGHDQPVRWTWEEALALEDAGFLPERFELINGEIISKMSEGWQHATVCTYIRILLTLWFGGLRVREAHPIAMPQTQDPYQGRILIPDLAVTAREASQYRRHPGPEDLLLAVEIAFSSQVRDLEDKAALYAAAGIVEYWVVDVAGRRLFVHREPDEDGYTVVEYGEEERVATLAAPELSVRVGELLPPLEEAT
jgi:Uma2 family endonuclease